MAQHKWHKEIKHWADGVEIECRKGDKWLECVTPAWNVQTEYRIKSQPKEPQYLYVYLDDNYELSTIPLDNDKWFLENRPDCKLHILPKAKVVPVTELYEECLF